MSDSQDYESLKDPNLNVYFKNKRIRRHLIKAGLINRHGDILPPASYEVVLAQRTKQNQAKQKLSHAITHYVIEEERRRQAFINNQIDMATKRSRIRKIRDSKQHQSRSMSYSLIHLAKRPKIRKARTPSPKSEKRSPVRPKSAHPPTINVKNQLPPRPTSTKDLKDEYCQVTMIYYGPPIILDNNITTNNNPFHKPVGDEIVVMQQHCGGENLVVFKGLVNSNETFTFESRRHQGYPFAVALYINGLIDSRISVCCEFKHKHNVRLGSNRGLFGIYDVQKSKPCPVCQFAQRKKKIISKTTTITAVSSSYQKSDVSRALFKTEFSMGNLLRTPNLSPPRDKESSKAKMTRISTVAQASLSPRRIDSPSPDKIKTNNARPAQDTKPKTTDTKKDNSGKLSRVSSSNSRKSGPSSTAISSKSEDIHNTFEPLFVTRKSDDDDNQSTSSRSSKNNIFKRFGASLPTVPIKSKVNHSRTSSSSGTSRKSGPSPTPIFNDKDDRRSSKSLSIASRKSEPSPIPIYNDEDDRNSLKSSSSSSRAALPIINNKADKHSLSSDEDEPPPPKVLIPKNDEDHMFSSSSSDTLKGSNSSIFKFFAEKKADEQIDTKKKTSRSSSSISKSSASSFKNTPDGKLLKEENGYLTSSSSSISEIADHSSLNNNQRDVQRHMSLSPSEESESSHHSIRNEPEPHRSSVSTLENEQINDLKPQTLPKTDPIPSDNDDDFIPKQRKRINDDEPSTKPDKGPVRQYRPVENIVVVWLDSNLKEPTNDTLSSKDELRKIVRTIRTYHEPEKCLQLFKEIKDDKIFLIVSGRFSEEILQQIGDHPQLAVVYIYCQENNKYESLMNKYSKINGIYTDIWTICERLKIDSKQWENDLNTFQVIPSIDYNQLNSQQILFIKNQLFKEYLLEIEYDKESLNDLVDYCQNLYSENDKEKELIQQFQNDYNPNNALYWYTKDCFIYHMLNRAIRMKDIKMLFQMGFFIRDINQQLQDIHSTTTHRSTLTVYRGQGMKLEYFEELKQNQGGLISFNGFLSTSMKRDIANDFARRSLENGFPLGVIFRIKINPKATSNPYGSLENQSSNPFEYEILFSFKTIFHIESIEQLENNLWQIDLNLINEKENEISQFIQIERNKFNNLTGFEKLGELLIEMNELHKAKDLYEVNIPLSTDPKYTYIYNQLGFIFTKLEVYNQALLCYQLALKTKSNQSLNDYVTISNIHNQIGKIYLKQNKIREALEQAQYTLNIQLEHLSLTHPSLANTYELFAMISEEDNDYETALDYYQKQLDIQEKSNQSNLALTHFKIALCLENLDRFDEAMDHIQQSIDISPIDDFQLNDRQTVLQRIREQLE